MSLSRNDLSQRLHRGLTWEPLIVIGIWYCRFFIEYKLHLTFIHNLDFIFSLTSLVLLFAGLRKFLVLQFFNSLKSSRLDDAFSIAPDPLYLQC